MTSQYGAYALRAGLARLHARMRMHTHIQKYVIIIAFPQHNGFLNAPRCYVIRTLSVLLALLSDHLLVLLDVKK